MAKPKPQISKKDDFKDEQTMGGKFVVPMNIKRISKTNTRRSNYRDNKRSTQATASACSFTGD